jgi:hypothetical protein
VGGAPLVQFLALRFVEIWLPYRAGRCKGVSNSSVRSLADRLTQGVFSAVVKLREPAPLSGWQQRSGNAESGCSNGDSDHRGSKAVPIMASPVSVAVGYCDEPFFEHLQRRELINCIAIRLAENARLAILLIYFLQLRALPVGTDDHRTRMGLLISISAGVGAPAASLRSHS